MSSSGNRLYQRWRALTADRVDRVAWTDAASGRMLSFGELATAAELAPASGGWVLAQSAGAEFLLQTLVAWRDGAPLVPLEPGAPFDPDLLRDLPGGVAHLKQTSGSTGEPKWVLFSEEQLESDVENIMATMGLADHAANVGVISLAHSYGFSNLVLPLLLHGVPLVTASDPLPASVDRALTLIGGDAILPAVPAMWRAWHAAGILDRERVGIAISAGAPLPLDLEQSVYASSGIKIHNFYGSSECGGIAYDRSDEPRQSAFQVGQALEGVEVAISDDGTLSVVSDSVGDGYWPPGGPGALLAGRRFQTADLAEWDEGGGVCLLGRADDLINAAGRKVAPQAIEAALAEVDGVDCCVVFGIPSDDPSRGDEIVACVRSQRPPNELAEALRSILPAWQQPKRWWVCKSLATNARGKISRGEWRRKFLARRD